MSAEHGQDTAVSGARGIAAATGAHRHIRRRALTQKTTMADILCGYTADRDETLIGYLYGEIEPLQRAAFEAHTATCERCRKELADLEGVRARLQDWTAPDAIRPVIHARMPSARVVPGRPAGVWTAMRDIPVWAQAAAALLVLGASAGMANLDVRYDQRGLTVH